MNLQLIQKKLELNFDYRKYRKSWLVLVAATIFISTANAQSNNPREIITLDSAWLFWQGDDAADKQPDFNDATWRTLNLPHDWTIESPVNPPPRG
ncbi:MAG: hypothetical protein ABIN93_12615 [Ginsengibacter sp.]